MKKQMTFTKKSPKEILKKKKHGILNFQNLHSVYLFNKEPTFQKAIMSKNNFTFPDGTAVSLFLKTKQIRGPSFTKDFFENKLTEKQKHFFILPEEEYLDELKNKFPKLKISKMHVPSYIQDVEFSKKEIGKIMKQIKRNKPDYVWVCIGNPKQEILSNQLHKKYKTFYLNVGAAMDFLLAKKAKAPKIFIKSRLEWLYRLITDFKYSKKKVGRSFIALMYLKKIKSE